MAVVRKLQPTFVLKATRAVFGRDFDLSVAYVSRTRMRILNRTYRGKDKPTNVLAFPLSKNSGEIVLCLPLIPTRAYLAYLFIHALLHLKGHDHGRIMDKLEQSYCGALGIQYPFAPNHNGGSNRSGHRRGHLPGARRRRPRGTR